MKILRMFDSLKFMRAMFVAVVAIFAFAPAHAATLPAGYTELEYLQTDGNSWIDTGIKGDMSYKYEIDFQQLDAGQYRNWGAFDQSGFSGGPNMSLTYATGFAVRWTVSGSASQVLSNFSSLDSNRHHIIIDNGYVTWDGVNKGRSTGHQDNYVFGYNLFLGTVNPGGNTPTSNAKSKYYSYKVWNTSGDLIQDLIPAKNSSGVVGMYDMVSGQFFTNAGTGEFIAGLPVSIKIATTRYNEQQFAPVETRLDAARTVINDLITQMQTNAVNVSKLAVEKQTRPNADCPAGKNCLLVTDPTGAENWYEIAGADAVQSSSNVPDYFSFTTTALNAGDSVEFYLTPSGTFTVDWGDGSTPQVIERALEDSIVYTHSYANAGPKTIKITGRANGYSTDSGVLDFEDTSQIASIDGSLGAIFPTLGNASGQQPWFDSTFSSTQITSIPAGLFSGVTGAAEEMFARTFQNAPITSIPAGLFSGITGAADRMFIGTFSRTQITSIPAGLFSGITGAAENMFTGTFAGCSNLTGYIPESAFAGLISAGSPDASNFMSQIFGGSRGLAIACPQNTTEVSTPYKSKYWSTNNGNAVMCRPN